MFRPKASVEYISDKLIWRLLVSPKENILIEERDLASKQASFTILEIPSQNRILTSHQFDETSWIGVEHFNDRFIILHKYIKPDMPFHKGVYIFDYYSQKVIWYDDELLFHHASPDYIYASSLSNQNYYKIKLDTGEKLEHFGSNFNSFSDSIKNDSPENMETDFLFPLFEFENSPDIEDASEISGINLENVEKPIEYINFSNFIIFAYNIKKSDGLFDNIIVIYNLQKKKKYLSIKLAENNKAKFLDSFFIKGNNLYLLKSKNSLLVYSLPV